MVQGLRMTFLEPSFRGGSKNSATDLGVRSKFEVLERVVKVLISNKFEISASIAAWKYWNEPPSVKVSWVWVKNFLKHSHPNLRVHGAARWVRFFFALLKSACLKWHLLNGTSKIGASRAGRPDTATQNLQTLWKDERNRSARAFCGNGVGYTECPPGIMGISGHLLKPLMP